MGRCWDPCITHRENGKVHDSLMRYFTEQGRKTLLVVGAGFDPRACVVAGRLRDAGMQMSALLIRENLPNPSQNQTNRAEANTKVLLKILGEQPVLRIDIFGPDGAMVGGRNVVRTISQQHFEGVTDVVVDISALSIGTSFPMIRYLFERAGHSESPNNLHLFMTHNPSLDNQIDAISSDLPSYIHGFKGSATLFQSFDTARLWLPQLATGKRQALGKLYDFVVPHDTCPILPFPAQDPRLGDKLAEEYLTEFENTWSVDARNIVYANEEDPA